jgi:hypothetical protein
MNPTGKAGLRLPSRPMGWWLTRHTPSSPPCLPLKDVPLRGQVPSAWMAAMPLRSACDCNSRDILKSSSDTRRIRFRQEYPEFLG